jgi:hypothetical protein
MNGEADGKESSDREAGAPFDVDIGGPSSGEIKPCAQKLKLHVDEKGQQTRLFHAALQC